MDLVFEIGTEELPASFQKPALEWMAAEIDKALDDARLNGEGEAQRANISSFATPRRLALIVTAIARRAPDIRKKLSGPPAKQAKQDGKWTKAAEGFARKAGVPLEALQIEGDRVVVEQHVGGHAAQEALPLGELLLAGKGQRYTATVIGLTGLGCLAAGLALSPFIPVIMKLWTTSYGLMSAGWACLLFLAFYWTIDVLGHRGWTLFLVVIGANALAAYLGPSIVQTHRMTNPFIKPLLPRMGAFGPVLAAGAVLLVNWLALLWMYRRKVFLKA